MVSITTDYGPCGLSLRRTCLIIPVYYLVITFLSAIVMPHYFSHMELFIGFIIILIGNFALLFGAMWSNHWLVLVWLIKGLLFLVGWPLVFLGILFNYGNYRQFALTNNVLVALCTQFAVLIIFLVLGRYVYSFHRQLRKDPLNPTATNHI